MRDGKVHLLLPSVIVVFLSMTAAELVVVIKACRPSQHYQESKSNWGRSGFSGRATQRPFLLPPPLLSLVLCSGGDRGTPGQQGPGHATHRGGMAG